MILERWKMMKLPNKVYDILKWVALIVMPALATFVGVMGTIWGYDLTRVVETIAALDTLLGALLGISCYQYSKDGE